MANVAVKSRELGFCYDLLQATLFKRLNLFSPNFCHLVYVKPCGILEASSNIWQDSQKSFHNALI